MLVCSQGSSLVQISPSPTDFMKPKSWPLAPLWCLSQGTASTAKFVLTKTKLRSTNRGNREGRFPTSALVPTKLSCLWDHQLWIKFVWHGVKRWKVRMERLQADTVAPCINLLAERLGRGLVGEEYCQRSVSLVKRPGWFGHKCSHGN